VSQSGEEEEEEDSTKTNLRHEEDDVSDERIQRLAKLKKNLAKRTTFYTSFVV
jgi:hypothetical protein